MKNKDLSSIKSVAIIGECMLELNLPNGLNKRTKKQTLNSCLAFGGDTLNTAIYLSRMGVETHYVTALGQDSFSDWMVEQWRAENIHCDLVCREKNSLPGLYAIETDHNGERVFSYWRERAPVRNLFSCKEKREKLFLKLKNMDLIYLSGITLSLFINTDREALFEFLSEYSAEGGVIVFDSNYRPQQWREIEEVRECFDRAYSLCDIVLSTLDDEQLLYPASSERQVIERLRAYGVDEIVLKKGPLGSVLANGLEQQFCPAKQVQVIDTTAAGDSFNAAYLASRIRGQQQIQAARNGHSLAAKVIQQYGAIINKSDMPPE